MIRGVHTMFYSSEPDALRAFLRDKLQFPHADVGQGWLIFDMPEAEMGCHPADPEKGGHTGTHNISFYCDDIQQTVADLTSRGVEFTMPVEDHGYGLVTMFKMPGDISVQLYQPRYPQRWSRAPAPVESVAAKRPPARRKAAPPKKRRRAASKPVRAKKRRPAVRKAATRRRAKR